MFATFIIVLREVLEAALIIGIVAAATRNLPGRNLWISAGVLGGLLGACAVAVSTGQIAAMASGVGQELMNAMVLGAAVLMLAWHNIWMASHGAELAARATQAGMAIKDGRKECSILLLIVGLAVLREGSETVLFLYGVAVSGGADTAAMLSGGLLGATVGALVGYAMYAGLLRIPLKWFFRITAILVMAIAAGMASQAARFMTQADLIPALADPLWNSSAHLSEQSVTGSLLHVLIGYDASPSGMQVLFYVSTLLAIGAGMKLTARGGATHNKI